MPGVHQPDPPGLIHDDLRLLPPGGGRPFFATRSIIRLYDGRCHRPKFARTGVCLAALSTDATPSTIRLWGMADRRTAPAEWWHDHEQRHPLARRRRRHCVPTSTASPLRQGCGWCTSASRPVARCGGRRRRSSSTSPAPVGALNWALPRRDRVLVIGHVDPIAEHWQIAISVGAQRVLSLPADEAELVSELSEAAEASGDGGRRGRWWRSSEDAVAQVPRSSRRRSPMRRPAPCWSTSTPGAAAST